MIEMYSGMGTPQSLVVVIGNKKQHTIRIKVGDDT